MSVVSLAIPDNVEAFLREKVLSLPNEYRSDFVLAVYDPREKRLVGNTWSLKWSGKDAYII